LPRFSDCEFYSSIAAAVSAKKMSEDKIEPRALKKKDPKIKVRPPVLQKKDAKVNRAAIDPAPDALVQARKGRRCGAAL
jgi:hypothetical protein